jgi:hypothetical protein
VVTLLPADSLLGLFFNPVEGRKLFLQNVSWLSNGLHGAISRKIVLFITTTVLRAISCSLLTYVLHLQFISLS